MRVTFPRLCSQPGGSKHRGSKHGGSKHGRCQCDGHGRAMSLSRSGTTYPHSAPSVVGGREPRAEQAFLSRFPGFRHGPGSGILAVGSVAY